MGYFRSLDDYKNQVKADEDRKKKEQEIQMTQPKFSQYPRFGVSPENYKNYAQQAAQDKIRTDQYNLNTAIGNKIRSTPDTYVNPEEQQRIKKQAELDKQDYWSRLYDQTRESMQKNLQESLFTSLLRKINPEQFPEYEDPKLNYKTGMLGTLGSEIVGMAGDPVTWATAGIGGAITKAPKVAGALGKLKPMQKLAAEGAIFGGLMGGAHETKDYVDYPEQLNWTNAAKSLGNIGLEAGMGAGGNLALGGLMKGIGKGINKVKSLGDIDLNIKSSEVPNKFQPIGDLRTNATPDDISLFKKQVIPKQYSGTFTVNNNRVAQQAQQELDDAIEIVQNHFGTNQLTPEEVARIKPELGIDFEALIARVENPQVDIRGIGERAKYAQHIGLNDVMARPDQSLYQLKYPRDIIPEPKPLQTPVIQPSSPQINPMNPMATTTQQEVINQFKKPILKKKEIINQVNNIPMTPESNISPLEQQKPNIIPNVPVTPKEPVTGLNNVSKIAKQFETQYNNEPNFEIPNNIPKEVKTNPIPNAIPKENIKSTPLTNANEPIPNVNKEPISQYRTNTIERAKLFDDDIREQMKEIDYAYTKESKDQWASQALNRLNNSTLDDEINRLTQSGNLKDAADVMETGMIAEALVNKGKINGDYTELNNFTRAMSEKLREHARILKAQDFAWDKATPEAAVLKTQKIINGIEDKFAKTHPFQYKKMQKKTNELTLSLKKVDNEALDMIAKEFDDMLKGGQFGDFKVEMGKESLNPNNISDKKIDTLIRNAFKDNGLKIGDVVRQFKQENVYKNIVDYVKQHPDLKGMDSKLITDHIQSRLNELTRVKKEQIVKSMFKDKVVQNRVKKTEWDKTVERIMVGAYDKGVVNDLVKIEKGLPLLNNEDIHIIIKHMELANKIEDKTSREFRKQMDLAQKPLQDKMAITTDEVVRALIKDTLLGFKSLVKNPTYNTFTAGAENLKDNPGTLIDYLTSKVTGKRTTGLPEYVIARKGNYTGGKRGLENYIKDIKENVNTSRSKGISEITQSSPFRNYESYPKGLKTIGKGLYKWDTFLNKGMKLGDDPFFESAFEGRIQELMKLNKVKEPTPEMLEDAFNTAKDRININDSNLAKFMAGKRRLVNQASGGVLGNLQDPFVQAPYNATDKALEYAGVGIFKAANELINAARKNKTFNQKKFVDSLARSITGIGGVGAVGTGLYAGNKLTGRYDTNKERYLFNKSVKGEKEHQLKTPLGNIDYKEFMPFAAPLAATAEYGKSKSLFNAGKSALNLLASQSSLQNASKIGGSAEYPGDIATGLYKTALGYPSMFVPNTVKKVAQLTDRTERNVKDKNPLKEMANNIVAGIPFARKSLKPKLDSYGKEMKTFGNRDTDALGTMGAFTEAFLSPFTTRASKEDSISKMLDSITSDKQLSDKDVSGIYPDIVPSSITQTKNKKTQNITLTEEQQTAYQKYVGQQTEAKYRALAESSDFRNKSNAKKVETLKKLKDKINEDAKKKILREMGK